MKGDQQSIDDVHRFRYRISNHSGLLYLGFLQTQTSSKRINLFTRKMLVMVTISHCWIFFEEISKYILSTLTNWTHTQTAWSVKLSCLFLCLTDWWDAEISACVSADCLVRWKPFCTMYAWYCCVTCIPWSLFLVLLWADITNTCAAEQWLSYYYDIDTG